MSNKKFSVRLVAAATMLAALAGMGQAQAAARFSAYNNNGGLGGGLASVAGPDAPLANLVINTAGIASWDAQDAPGNTVLTLNVLPNSVVDAISYNVSIATVGLSWLSEAAVLFTNSAGDGVVLTAGYGDDMSGTGTYSDSALLSDFGLSFNIGADGRLFVQFFETYDDVANAADARYTAGNITFGNIGAVPEPASYGLMALGLVGVAGVARRKVLKAA